jgi:energy-coupling factor transporter ATP-binding protein EcfA2
MKITGWSIDGFGIFNDYSVSDLASQLTLVLGPKEAGKSTLLHLIFGREFPDRGQIIFNGKDISNLAARDRAHLGMGAIWETSGDVARAAAHYSTAAQAALKNSGEKWLAGQTEHDLLALAAVGGDPAVAYYHAKRALRWTPRAYSRLPFLVHDYAVFLLHMHFYSEAQHLLRLVVQTPAPPVAKVLMWSTLGRVAGVLGDEVSYRDAEKHVEAGTKHFALHAAGAHMNLGTGAWALGLRQDAQRHARVAYEYADTRGEQGLIADVEELLQNLRTGTSLSEPAHSAPPHLAELAAAFANRLKSWRAPTSQCRSGSRRSAA